jgi:hypothetical protein
MIDDAHFSGGEIFERLQKLGLVVKGGSAFSQSVRVAELAKRLVIRECKDPRRTTAARKVRGKVSRKVAQVVTLEVKPIVVEDSEQYPNKKKSVQTAVGNRDLLSMTSIEDEENEELTEEDEHTLESDEF